MTRIFFPSFVQSFTLELALFPVWRFSSAYFLCVFFHKGLAATQQLPSQFCSSVPRALATPHQLSFIRVCNTLQVMSVIVPVAPLFLGVVEILVHLKSWQVPRHSFLLFFPHLIHLYSPPKSLRRSVLCFLPSLFLRTNCHISFSFGTISSLSFHSSTWT